MCGLVGIAGDINAPLEKVFKTMLILDSLRGTDSTGVGAIGRHNEPIIAKQMGNPYELMDHSTFTRAMSKLNRALIGHNRFATQGGVNRANAHPYEFETLIGAHNGTLTNKYKLDDSADYKVDSQNLYHHINKNGLKHAINLIEGAWSLVWWDKVEETLNFLRNKERPMWITKTKDGKTLLWASEAWMVEVACMRERVEIQDIIETEVDIHYAFDIPKNAINQEYVGKPRVQEVKGFKPVATTTVYGTGWHGYQGNVYGRQQQQQVLQPTTKSGASDNQSITPTGKVVTFPKATTRTVQVVSEPQARGGAASYSGAKNVKMDVLSEATDRNGARYVICFDDKMPQTHIRLYLKKGDKSETLIGEEIIASIGKYHLEGGERGFYKVDYGTFRLANPKRNGNSQAADSSPKLFPSTNGRMLNKAAWEHKHGTCVWCSGTIQAEDDHEFTNEGDILCTVCVNDEEVKAYRGTN